MPPVQPSRGLPAPIGEPKSELVDYWQLILFHLTSGSTESKVTLQGMVSSPPSSINEEGKDLLNKIEKALEKSGYDTTLTPTTRKFLVGEVQKHIPRPTTKSAGCRQLF